MSSSLPGVPVRRSLALDNKVVRRASTGDGACGFESFADLGHTLI